MISRNRGDPVLTKTRGIMETIRFVKFWLFEGAPNPAVSSIAELRPDRRNGKYTVWSETAFRPLDEEVRNRHFTKEEGVILLQKHDFIRVKSDFDQHSIEDLREIKHLIPERWVFWFNEALKAYG